MALTMDLRIYRRRLHWPVHKPETSEARATPPDAVDLMPALWRAATRIAIIGMFVIMLGAVLMETREITAPVCAAIIVGSIVGPFIERLARSGVPPFLAALGLVAVLVAFLYGLAVVFSGSIATWIERAPEIGATLRERFSVLREPLSALKSLGDAVNAATGGDSGLSVSASPGSLIAAALAAATPAVAQFVVFVGSLFFFLAGRAQMKRRLVVGFMTRDARLLALRIVTAIERNLGLYLGTVTLINAGLGLVTGLAMWAIGLPNAALWGLLAFVLNYIPFLGPILMMVVLLGVGMISFPTLGLSLLPVALFTVLHGIEAQFVSPGVIGRRLTLNPFLVFLALAFWTWIWGPLGAFLAVPILVICFVVVDHVFPKDEVDLPG